VPFLALEDGKLFYEISGKGRWLVLIHGAWASHEWWRWQGAELSRRYRILSYDLRGHGRSSPLPLGYTVDGFSRDLEILVHRAGMEELALIGWSLGGLISLRYCAKNPSQVKALVLIATPAQGDPKLKRRIQFQYWHARLSLMFNLAAPRKYDRLDQSFPGERKRVEEELNDLLHSAAPPEVREWIRADLERLPSRDYLAIAKSFWDWKAEKDLARVRVPTLILAGEEDRRTPPASARELHLKIPDSSLMILAQAGHCLPLERPERVNREITEYLQRVGYGGESGFRTLEEQRIGGDTSEIPFSRGSQE